MYLSLPNEVNDFVKELDKNEAPTTSVVSCKKAVLRLARSLKK